MRQIRCAFIAFSLLFSATSFALGFASSSDKYSYPVQKVNLRGVRDIRIIGVNGRLKLRGRGRSASLNLRVQHSKSTKYEDWHLEVERRGSTLFLEVFNVAYGKQWDNQVRKEAWPEFDIELEGPSLPVTVAWREGHLQFQNWNAKLEVSFLKGDASVYGGRGDLILQPVQADITVAERTGDLSLKGESGNVRLKRTAGPLTLNWLSGSIALEECVGDLHGESQRSDVNVKGGHGMLSVQMGEGFAKIAAFAGSVSALGERASWALDAVAPANVNVVTSSGPVALTWSGGGKVFLSSKKGAINIQHSDFIAVSSKPGPKIAEGTKTARVMGQVFVRTDSGGINWRQ